MEVIALRKREEKQEGAICLRNRASGGFNGVMIPSVLPTRRGDGDRFARFLGIFVFLGGVVGLGVCFYYAWRLFVEAFTRPLSQNLGVEVAGWLIRLLLLLVMGYLSSSIAGRGIDLYWAARYEGVPVSRGVEIPKRIRETTQPEGEKEEAIQEG